MSSDRLGIGFIGSGFITRFHIQSMVGVREADVLGVWSPNDEHAEAAAALNGTELIIVRGSEDPSLDEALRLKEERRLGEAGIRYRFVSYRGGHDIDRETLLEIAAQ